MSSPPNCDEYPLQLLALPHSVSSLLRHAGIRAETVRPGGGMASDDQGRWPHIVLFDSTCSESVRLADAALRGGSACIDVDPLLAEAAAAAAGPRLRLKNEKLSAVTTVETHFLRSLKRSIEVEGGIWMRLSDYPFPFHSAICGRDSSKPDDASELLRACGACAWQEGETVHWDGSNAADQAAGDCARNRHLADWMRSRYSNGLPIMLDTNSDLAVARKLLQGEVRQPNPFPLLWKTTLTQFAQWWATREQLQWNVSRGERGYTVSCQGDFGKFRPALEVWKNRHLAVVPLSNGETVLNEGHLVFQGEHQRLVGGIASRCSILDRKPVRALAARPA